MFNVDSPTDLAQKVADRLRALRLQRNISQQQLATDAGITRPTLSRFELTGVGSIDTLVRLMYTLGRESELDGLLRPDPPSTLDEVTRVPARKRASKSS